MSRLLSLISIGAFVVLSGCGDLPPSAAAIRHVILYNDGAPTVTIATDLEALQAIFDELKSSSSLTRARVKVFEVDGQIFEVTNGTRADVLKEVPFSGVPGVTLLRVRVRTGPHITEEGICFSTVTQPDNA